MKAQIPRAKSESSFAFLKMQSPPSIPSHGSVFGYEEAEKGMLIKQSNPDKAFKGEKGDTIGPGQYNVPSCFEAKKAHGLKWQNSKSKRELYDTKNKTNVDFVTSRDYNIFPIYKFKNSSVFASNVPRMKGLRKKKEIKSKRAALSAPRKPNALEDMDSDEDDGIPGPGFYHNPGATSDFTIEPYKGRNQYFGSTVERFQYQKVICYVYF